MEFEIKIPDIQRYEAFEIDMTHGNEVANKMEEGYLGNEGIALCTFGGVRRWASSLVHFSDISNDLHDLQTPYAHNILDYQLPWQARFCLSLSSSWWSSLVPPRFLTHVSQSSARFVVPSQRTRFCPSGNHSRENPSSDVTIAFGVHHGHVFGRTQMLRHVLSDPAMFE